MVKINKKGWTTVMEVFVSILLLVSVLTLILSAQSFKEDRNGEVYKKQALALKIIQSNDNLRQDIINGQVSQEIVDILDKTISDDLACEAKICISNSECNLDAPPEKREIFAKGILITSTKSAYNPKELKLFCWEK